MTDAPTKAVAGVTPGWLRLRVVDASTGEVIERVLEADADAGTLTCSAVGEDGNLLRDGDKFVTVTEQRAIRIEWIDEEAPTPVPVEPDAPHGADA